MRARTTALVALGLVLPALAVPAAAGATTLIGSGSSAAQPFLLALFRAYNKVHHGVRFLYTPDGGNAGVKDVQSGHSQFAVNTRPPLPSDSGTSYSKLFLDGLCIAVNPSNRVTDLSISTVKSIFTAKTTNWSQVPGSDLQTTIDPVGRNASAGTYTFFQQAVLGKQTQASNVNAVTSDGLVATALKNDPNAIGYVGLAHAGAASGVKTVTLGGVPCDAGHIRSETYPLFRYDWGVLPLSNPNPQVQKFFDWVRTSKKAGQIIARAGAVPAFNRQ
jgi:phosphate transport system substrate-binding protein